MRFRSLKWNTSKPFYDGVALTTNGNFITITDWNNSAWPSHVHQPRAISETR
jgi:hypothetical protein